MASGAPVVLLALLFLLLFRIDWGLGMDSAVFPSLERGWKSSLGR